MDKDLIARASISINAPRDQVWDALVNPQVIRQYMFDTQVVSDWRAGSPIVWKGEWQGQAYEDKGVILQFEPGRTLQYSHFSPLSGLPDKPENYHTVTIELSADGNQTYVSLTQDKNASEEERAHSEKNWEMMLAALKKLLEQHTPQSHKPASKPNPALKHLEVLVGEWNTVGTHPLFPGATLRSRVSFEWLEGGAFLIMYSDVEQPGPPSAIAVFSRDDSVETYSMLYFDERGVSRIYEMSLSGGVWKLWRNSPGFSQRFTGTFNDDGKTITGVWELSKDGSNWEHDLELTYTRIR